MICIEVEDVKSFMSKLLVKDNFDCYYMHELEIESYCKFNLDGKLNKRWYSNDEIEMLDGRIYTIWKENKHLAYEFIRGSKTPTRFKVVLSCSEDDKKNFILKSGLVERENQVERLFLNIRFENGQLYITTGVAYTEFTMDKSIENEWDNFVKHME